MRRYQWVAKTMDAMDSTDPTPARTPAFEDVRALLIAVLRAMSEEWRLQAELMAREGME
jgi:hypothetical protein